MADDRGAIGRGVFVAWITFAHLRCAAVSVHASSLADRLAFRLAPLIETITLVTSADIRGSAFPVRLARFLAMWDANVLHRVLYVTDVTSARFRLRTHPVHAFQRADWLALTVDSLVTKIAGARVRRGAISVLLFAVLGAYWLADTVLVHLISEIALAYVWRYAFSVLAIAAIR